jgi:hypothetical protein
MSQDSGFRCSNVNVLCQQQPLKPFKEPSLYNSLLHDSPEIIEMLQTVPRQLHATSSCYHMPHDTGDHPLQSKERIACLLASAVLHIFDVYIDFLLSAGALSCHTVLSGTAPASRFRYPDHFERDLPEPFILHDFSSHLLRSKV